MTNASYALAAPLTNPELSQHIQIQAVEHTNPASSAYVGDANARIQGISYEYLGTHISNATHNLVNDDHELDTEELEEDLEELKSWLDFDIQALKKALRNPTKARELIKTISKTPPPIKDQNVLTLEEVHRYIRALEKDKSATSSRDRG